MGPKARAKPIMEFDLKKRVRSKVSLGVRDLRVIGLVLKILDLIDIELCK